MENQQKELVPKSQKLLMKKRNKQQSRSQNSFLLLVLLLLIFFSSCFLWDDQSHPKPELKVIEYGTEEFHVFEEKASIKLDQAWKIYLNFRKNKQKESNFLYPLFVCVDQYYVFSFPYYNHLLDIDLDGIYVHSETGEVQHKKNTEKRYRLQFTRGYLGSSPPREKKGSLRRKENRFKEI